MNIVTRQQWGARDPVVEHYWLPGELPVAELWLHHTADNNTGAQGMRNIQNFHMDGRGWRDIAYNFVVDRDGTVYEGRGFGVKPGATRGHNDVSHAICVMGNYQARSVADVQVEALAQLVAEGAARGYWPRQFTGGHRDVGQTSCPGNNLYVLLDEINRRAFRDERYVMDVMLYADRKEGGPDLLSALAGAAAKSKGVAVTMDASVAQAAADNGVKVYAIGGPAKGKVNGATELVGRSARETLAKVAEAAKDW